MKQRVSLLTNHVIVAAALASGLTACTKQQTVVVYVSEDQVFVEPIMKGGRDNISVILMKWSAQKKQ